MFQMTLIDERIQKKLFNRISQLNRTEIDPLNPVVGEGETIKQGELMKDLWVRVISAVPTKQGDSYSTDFLRLSSAFEEFDVLNPKNEPISSNMSWKKLFGDKIPREGGTYRPHAGVTGVTTEFQNHSIQNITINWKLYDMDSFKKYQNAFLKHGRTILVEFGWGSYDTLGKVNVNNVDSMLEYFESIQEKIFEMGGDYYASCGVVSGFNWNVIEGGGFECTTTLTSMGNTMFKSQIEPYIGGEFPDVSSQAKSDTVEDAYTKANFTFLSQMTQLNEWIGALNETDVKISEQKTQKTSISKPTETKIGGITYSPLRG